jgi:hypothetical protein
MADPDVVRLATGIVEADGETTSAELEELRALRRRCERLREVSGWPHTDWPNWHKAQQSLWILQQLTCAAD